MIRLSIKVVVLALTTLVVGTATMAIAAPWQSNVYTVRNDPGGYVIDYALKMRKMERSGREIRFHGRCDSACTLFLALPKTQACVSRGAAFGFHLPMGESARGNRVAANFMLNTYPAWVRNWLAANGGLTTRLKVMRFDYASRHMPECNIGRTVHHDASAANHLVSFSRD